MENRSSLFLLRIPVGCFQIQRPQSKSHLGTPTEVRTAAAGKRNCGELITPVVAASVGNRGDTCSSRKPLRRRCLSKQLAPVGIQIRNPFGEGFNPLVKLTQAVELKNNLCHSSNGYLNEIPAGLNGTQM
jgi:hypothetical protein